jgi:hypothetical protein
MINRQAQTNHRAVSPPAGRRTVVRVVVSAIVTAVAQTQAVMAVVEIRIDKSTMVSVAAAVTAGVLVIFNSWRRSYRLGAQCLDEKGINLAHRSVVVPTDERTHETAQIDPNCRRVNEGDALQHLPRQLAGMIDFAHRGVRECLADAKTHPSAERVFRDAGHLFVEGRRGLLRPAKVVQAPCHYHGVQIRHGRRADDRTAGVDRRRGGQQFRRSVKCAQAIVVVAAQRVSLSFALGGQPADARRNLVVDLSGPGELDGLDGVIAVEHDVGPTDQGVRR